MVTTQGAVLRGDRGLFGDWMTSLYRYLQIFIIFSWSVTRDWVLVAVISANNLWAGL